MEQKYKVVILGGGFGGLAAAQKLRRAPVDVTLIDRSSGPSGMAMVGGRGARRHLRP